VAVGGAAWLLSRGEAAPSAAIAARAEALQRDGRSVAFVSIDGVIAGVLGIVDPNRPEAAAAVVALRREGLALVIATGDSLSVAEGLARSLGIAAVEAGLLPAGKAALVRGLKSRGHRVAMAGDGVNDAPALASADVGIALGSGTDVAKGSAGITLVRGDLWALVRARRLGRATLRNVRQNLFFAFAYNALCIPLAAGALYPVFGRLLSPAVAAAAMSLSSVTVIANALRLRRVEL